jgi:hypothetical protein
MVEAGLHSCRRELCLSMTVETTTPVRRQNRRASRRLAPKAQLRVECRKSVVGLGMNIAGSVLDVSETGIRLIVKAPLEKNKDVEIILTGASYVAPIKRVARVVWVLPTENDCYAAGLNFSPALDYAAFQRLCAGARQMA